MASSGAWYRERRAQRIADGLCERCGGGREDSAFKHCATCRAAHAEKMRTRYARLRAAALAAYGGACECCGEAEERFLTIDHIDGGGHQHRRSIGGPARIVEWLAKHGYPEGFRVLCWNCNCARAFNGGVCPHEEQRADVVPIRAVV